jgi:hypothetical protein
VDNDEGSKNGLFGLAIIIMALGAKEVELFKPSTLIELKITMF